MQPSCVRSRCLKCNCCGQHTYMQTNTNSLFHQDKDNLMQMKKKRSSPLLSYFPLFFIFWKGGLAMQKLAKTCFNRSRKPQLLLTMIPKILPSKLIFYLMYVQFKHLGRFHLKQFQVKTLIFWITDLNFHNFKLHFLCTLVKSICKIILVFVKMYFTGC